MNRLIFVLVLLLSAICLSQSTDSLKVTEYKQVNYNIVGYSDGVDTVFVANNGKIVQKDSVSYPIVTKFDMGWYTMEVWSYPKSSGYLVDTLYAIKSDLDLIRKIIELENLLNGR
jgi:hypothetical protein